MSRRRLPDVGVILIWILAHKSLVQACVRNETRIEEGRICNPLCNRSEGCSSPREKCICDDVCGWSCFDPGLRCGELESPRFGYIIGDDMYYDDTVIYYCHSGYILSGPNHRRCRSDGSWTGVSPRCLPVSTCGLVEKPEEKIIVKKVVRGTKTTVKMWPWHVLLIENRDNKVSESFKALHGAGTIINERWVLTAAHLFLGSSWKKRYFLDHSILLVAGITELPESYDRLDPEIQVYRPSRVIRHSQFHKPSNDNDICLIQVGARMVSGQQGLFQPSPLLPSYRFTYTKFVRPVCLPCINEWAYSSSNATSESEYHENRCETRGNNIFKTPAVTTGFGGMDPIDQKPNFLVKWSTVLRQGTVQVLPNNICAKGVKLINTEYEEPKFTDNMICARGSDPDNMQDACRGDSGGPLVQKVTSRSGDEYWILTGLVSWGWGCANENSDGFVFPGYFMNVTRYVPWISQKTETYKSGVKDPRSWIITVRFFIYVERNDKLEYTIHELPVDINSTVKSVKIDIQNIFPAYPEWKQQFYTTRYRLSQNRTLKSYRIQDGHFIIVRIF